MSEEAYAAVVCSHLREHLRECAAGGFDERTLDAALAYSRTVPLRFLSLALPPGVRRVGLPFALPCSGLPARGRRRCRGQSFLRPSQQTC